MKKIVASIKNQASSETKQPEKGETDNLEMRPHHVDRGDDSASRDDGDESEITQYSSESSGSAQHIEAKGAKVVESNAQKRRSTRLKGGRKKAS